MKYVIGNIVRLVANDWKARVVQHDVECVITDINPEEEYPYRVKSLNFSEPILESTLMNLYSVNTKEEGLIYVRSK